MDRHRPRLTLTLTLTLSTSKSLLALLSTMHTERTNALLQHLPYGSSLLRAGVQRLRRPSSFPRPFASPRTSSEAIFDVFYFFYKFTLALTLTLVPINLR